MGKFGGNSDEWGYGTTREDQLPWYLTFRALGCWLWMAVGSVLLGIFASLIWWWAVTALLGLALAVLARDPDA